MSEDNSGRGKQEPSFEQVDDEQAAHLDSLIAQFEDDFDIESIIDTEQSLDDAEAGLVEPDVSEANVFKQDESSAQPMKTIEEAVEAQPSKQIDPTIIFLSCFIGFILLCVVIGLTFGRDDGNSAVVHPVVSTKLSTKPVQTAAIQPAVPTATDQQENALRPVLENKQVPAGIPVPDEPPVSAVEKKKSETQTAAAPVVVSMQHLYIDPISRKVIAPKVSKTGVIAWAVNLTSLSTLAAARQIQESLASRGIASELVWVTIGQRSFYRVRISGFHSKKEAEQARRPFLKEREFSSAWLEVQ